MTLQEILSGKGSGVHTITPSSTLEDVVQTLVKHNCGSLVVCDSADGARRRMLGIITERDILRACAAHLGSLESISVSHVMTTNVVTGAPADSIEDTMGLMTDKRIRHLPVLNGDQLVGIVSIGDIVKTQHDQLTMENHYLKSYIQS